MQHHRVGFHARIQTAFKGRSVSMPPTLLLLILVLVFSCGELGAAGSREQSGTGAGASGEDSAQFEEVRAESLGLGAPVTLSSGMPLIEPDGQPAGASQFSTDFTRTTIDYSEIRSGGPPKDGIPALTNPSLTSIDAADAFLSDDETVLVFTANAEAVIYPVRILMYHEIANDRVGGVPVTVTYCPLCNTAIAFDRRVGGEVLDFGTTGLLRYSNLIMYDRQTESFWQQASGNGIAGEYAGLRLRTLPLLTLPWDEARRSYPDAAVLGEDTGHARPYGRNPYAGYDTAPRPFLYDGPEPPGEEDYMSRVLVVQLDGEEQAFLYRELAESGFEMARIAGEDVVVFWEAGTASPLDSREVATGRDIGTANAFLADGRRFARGDNGSIVDAQDGSVWTAGGRAISGPAEGQRLEPVPTIQHFWFSYTAFADESADTP